MSFQGCVFLLKMNGEFCFCALRLCVCLCVKENRMSGPHIGEIKNSVNVAMNV